MSNVRVANGQYIGTVEQAKIVVAQLTAEKQRAALVNDLLVKSLDKEQIAILRSNGLMQGMANASGSASFALLSLTQGIQDAGNFGMGAAQGIRAVNNNIQAFVTAATFAASQTEGGMVAVFKNMGKAMLGPAGILFAFSAVSAAIEFFANRSQMAKTKANELKNTFSSLFSVMQAPGIEGTVQGIEFLVGTLEAFSASVVANGKLIEEAFRMAGPGPDGLVQDGLKTALELNTMRKDVIESALPKMKEELELQKKINEAYAATVQRLGVDGLLAAMIKGREEIEKTKSVVDKASLVAESGLGSESEFDKGFKSFSESLKAVNSDLKITEAEFAKLTKLGETANKLKEEWKKGPGRWASGFTDSIESAKDSVAQLEENLRRLQGPEGERFVALELQAKELREQVELAKQLIAFDLSGLPVFIKKVQTLGPVIMPPSDKPAVKSAGELMGAPQSLRVPPGLEAIIADQDIANRVETDADRAIAALGKLNNAFENVASQGIASMIDGLAQLAAGQEKNLAVALILPLADMAIQLGKISIGAGVALLGIKKAFENPANAGVAIAAGAALVALGTVVKSQISKTGASVGASGGGDSISSTNTFAGFTNVNDLPGGSQAFLTTSAASQRAISISLVADGRELIGVIDNVQDSRAVMIGSRRSSGGIIV
jgi:hypothetical protein